MAGFGAELIRVPYKNDHIDLDALLEAAKRHKPVLVFFANPDNPMGTWHDAKTVKAFMDDLPEETVLIYDEAYIEFAPPELDLPIDTSNPRVIRMRTFSKAHGMAGARVGYAVAHKAIIGGYNKIRNHFGMSRISLAGAQASLQDTEFVQSVVDQVDEGRREYYAMAQSLGLAAIPSATNFVAIDLGSGDRARAVLKALEARGVFVRMPAVEPMDRCIRVSVGLPQERAAFREAFEAVLKEFESRPKTFDSLTESIPAALRSADASPGRSAERPALALVKPLRFRFSFWSACLSMANVLSCWNLAALRRARRDPGWRSF